MLTCSESGTVLSIVRKAWVKISCANPSSRSQYVGNVQVVLCSLPYHYGQLTLCVGRAQWRRNPALQALGSTHDTTHVAYQLQRNLTMKGNMNTAIVGSAKNTVYMLLFIDIATLFSPNTINTTRLVRLRNVCAVWKGRGGQNSGVFIFLTTNSCVQKCKVMD